MSQAPNDDLFKESTMSFGEHLEELRVSLFRAMAGLVVGVVIALVIAHHVVHAIQGPLKNALDAYYLEKAETDLLAEFKLRGEDIPPPEELALIRAEGFVPSQMYLDAEGIVTALKMSDPTQFGDLEYVPYRFVPTDIRDGQLAALCKTLSDGSKTAGSKTPAGLLWSLMTSQERKEISNLAEETDPDEDDLDKVAEILNKLAEQEAIATSEQFASVNGVVGTGGTSLNPVDWLKALFADQDTFATAAMKTVSALRDKAKAAAEGDGRISKDQLRRLNKLLIASAFARHLHAPRRLALPVKTWKPTDIRVQTLNAQEAFMIWLKAALITGFVITSPWIFLQVWNFVAAGLYPHEKQYVYIYLPFSLLLFLCGTGLAFFFVFEPVLNFLFGFNKLMDIDPDPRISEWLSFVLFLPLGFGIAFQLPLVMLFLNRIGMFALNVYWEKWRIAILVIFVISMLLTPADPISMLLMAMPLTILYFLGIALCKWMPKGRNPFAEGYEPT